MPNTIDETQQHIIRALEEINGQEELILQTREESAQAPADQREGLQRKLDRLTADLEAARVELKLLRARLQQLRLQPPKQESLRASDPPGLR